MFSPDEPMDTLSEMTSQPHLPLGHVLLDNHELFYAMGLRDPLAQRLGKGAFGAAYQIPAAGGSVLKLTRDLTEVQAATLLKGRDSKRIVHVHDVWAVDGTGHPGESSRWAEAFDDLAGWFAIHRGLLTPLSKRDTALVEAIFQVFGDVELDLVIPRSMKQHATLQKWRNYLREELMSGDAMPMSESEDGGTSAVNPLGGSRAVKQAMILLVQIGEAVNEMHKVGIDWEDIHPDNIMRNDRGRLVIADFGFGLMHDDFDKDIPVLTMDAIVEHLAPTPETAAR